MLRKIKNVKAYEDFINTVNCDPSYADPMLSTDEEFKSNLYGAAEKEDNVVLGIFNGEKITGLFDFLVIEKEKYAEMLVGLSKDKNAYEELFVYLLNNYADYNFDFVFNPRNVLLLNKLKTLNAVFDTEQQKMKLKRYNKIDRKHKIMLYDENHREGYLAIHDDDGIYWVGSKVLDALDRFRVILCVADDRVVGYVDVTYTFDENEPYAVFVLPKYRNRGIATEMLSYALELNGDKDMMLSVDIDNVYAIRMYEKLGFEKTSRNILTAHLTAK